MQLLFNAEIDPSDYMSAPTHFLHLFVTDFAKMSMYALELLSVLIILFTTIVAFYKLIKHDPFARVYLLHGQSVGLSFKLGSEILRTVTAKNIDDIWEVLLLIIVKAFMVLLIDWELRGLEKGHAVEHDGEHKGPKERLKKMVSPFFSNESMKKQPTIQDLKDEVTSLKDDVEETVTGKSSPSSDAGGSAI